MAPDAARPVEQMAASVADGAAVDWERRATDLSAREQRIAHHLRLIQTVAEVYRSLPSADESPHLDAVQSPDPAGPRWGRLVLLDRVGRGASSDVFRAWDVDLQREVALKLLFDDGVTGNDAANARLLHEARRLARVRHPHVVHVYGAERHEGRVGLWMELVRGRSLAEIVRADGPLEAPAAAAAGADLCAALAAVHAAGLLHRDVKAQNVVRDETGRLVLMDFGAGEEIGAGRAHVAGTPLYLAPEVLAGGRATTASDIYSTGVLLFFLVTGRYPVEGESIEALAAAHHRGQRRTLAQAAPLLPGPFARTVDRALDPDPAKRFETAASMESALRRSMGPARRETAPSWRTWVLVAATAAAVAALVETAAHRHESAAVTIGPATSIAVLPLTTVSGGAQAPLVADGLTDELITTLGQVQSLRVTAHTSVERYKGTDRPVSEIASELGVGSVLEGSVGVETSGNPRVHVNMRLIRAGTDIELWSDSFDRPLANVMAIEAEIARAVASSVRAQLTPRESARLQSGHATTAAAEQAYLEGRAHLSQFASRASLALAAFRRAIAADPEFAPAHAGAARAFVALGFDRAMSQPAARASALAEAERAIALQPDLAEGHAARADLRFYYDWDFDGAEREYRAALDLDPSAPFAEAQYAQFLAAIGRLDEARVAAADSAARDPLSAAAELTRALVLYYSRQFDAALQAAQHAAALDPTLPTTHFMQGRILEARGDLRGAAEETQRAIESSAVVAVGWRVQALRLQALGGDRQGARDGFAALKTGNDGGYLASSPYEAYLRLATGEPDAALRILARAVDNRDPSVLWIGVDPRLDPIRGRPEFLDLRTRIGLR